MGLYGTYLCHMWLVVRIFHIQNNKAHFLKVVRRKREEIEEKNVTAILLKGRLIKAREY
jgi:hypothetical protein